MKEKQTSDGFTANLWNGKHWSEAYGYLGSYYKSYGRALFEIRFLLREFPEKYQEWAIERIVLQDGFRVRDERIVVLAHSKNAPVWDLQEDREVK